MREIETTAESFQRKSESYRNHIENLPELQTGSAAVKLKFSSELKENIKETWDECQFTENEDGTITLTVDYPDDSWLTAMILSYGPQVEVLEPEELREKIAIKTEQTAAIYRQ